MEVRFIRGYGNQVLNHYAYCQMQTSNVITEKEVKIEERMETERGVWRQDKTATHRDYNEEISEQQFTGSLSKCL